MFFIFLPSHLLTPFSFHCVPHTPSFLPLLLSQLVFLAALAAYHAQVFLCFGKNTQCCKLLQKSKFKIGPNVAFFCHKITFGTCSSSSHSMFSLLCAHFLTHKQQHCFYRLLLSQHCFRYVSVPLCFISSPLRNKV